MKQSLEFSSVWSESPQAVISSEQISQEVAWQFSFSDANGTFIDPDVMDVGMRGDVMLLSLMAERDRLLETSVGHGEWSSMESIGIVVMKFSLSLTLKLKTTNERMPEEVRSMSLSIFSPIVAVAAGCDLNCRLLSVSVKRVSNLTTQAWYVGAGEHSNDPDQISDVQAIGNAVREQRDLLHVSLDEAARLSGVARRTILRLEQGGEGISIGNSMRIAGSLGLQIHAKRLP